MNRFIIITNRMLILNEQQQLTLKWNDIKEIVIR